MTGSTPSRRAFLATAGALAATPAAGAAQELPSEPLDRVDRALVLSGGGARGAYEAGIIDCLRLSRGTAEGEPLAPYGFVAGTSIGAINGYFLATAQYGRLRELWYGISDQRVLAPKRQYAKIRDQDSGLLNRGFEAALLIRELVTSDTGVIDGDRLREWLERQIDAAHPVVMPFVWTVTNLSRQAPEFFYLVPTALTGAQRAQAVRAIRLTVGPRAVLREATPDVLVDALRASAAIPIAFDPVVLPSADGSTAYAYVDGGVTANTPVSVARAAARRIDVVLLDPPFQTPEYRSSIDIGVGVFGAMQRRILESDLRAAFLESYAKIFETNIYQMFPRQVLPVGIAGFNDRDHLFATYAMGFDDAKAGFTPYEFLRMP
jgi:predicted acylesterase/phospholipase RssA